MNDTVRAKKAKWIGRFHGNSVTWAAAAACFIIFIILTARVDLLFEKEEKNNSVSISHIMSVNKSRFLQFHHSLPGIYFHFEHFFPSLNAHYVYCLCLLVVPFCEISNTALMRKSQVFKERRNQTHTKAKGKKNIGCHVYDGQKCVYLCTHLYPYLNLSLSLCVFVVIRACENHLDGGMCLIHQFSKMVFRCHCKRDIRESLLLDCDTVNLDHFFSSFRMVFYLIRYWRLYAMTKNMLG